MRPSVLALAGAGAAGLLMRAGGPPHDLAGGPSAPAPTTASTTTAPTSAAVRGATPADLIAPRDAAAPNAAGAESTLDVAIAAAAMRTAGNVRFNESRDLSVQPMFRLQVKGSF